MLEDTGLWQDLAELPEALAATLASADGFADVARLLSGDSVRRVVATGNGAAYYVAIALWLASLEGEPGPEVVAVPSGLVARGAFRWRPGDVLLAISSSGEFRDVVEAIEGGAPAPYAAVTATAGSTIGSRAGARALVRVLHQRAVTHTQAFCSGVAAALAVWAQVTTDSALGRALHGLPDVAAASLASTGEWLAALDTRAPETAIAFGSGPAWAGALEAALLLKEVAGVPAEGVETREGATSAMMALRPGHLVLSLPTGPDVLLEEAERICSVRGATVVRAPAPADVDRRLAAVTTFVPAAALSGSIGRGRGLDVDTPSWTDDYYRVARQP